jgi:hypothetical protein
MRSSAQPRTAFFDIGSKHFALILDGAVVDAPTVVFVPRQLHYPNDFEVRASTRDVFEWDDRRQLLAWRPDKSRTTNQIVICPAGAFRADALPPVFQGLLGSLNAPLRAPTPFGSLDDAAATPTGVHVAGWAIDPDTTAPINVRVSVDGAPVAVAGANGARPDVGAQYPGYGSAHGYALDVRAAPGTHSVCAYAVNVAAGGRDTQLGCRTVIVPVPAACASLEVQVGTLEEQISELQDELVDLPYNSRRAIVLRIQRLQAQLSQARLDLAQCIAQHTG